MLSGAKSLRPPATCPHFTDEETQHLTSHVQAHREPAECLCSELPGPTFPLSLEDSPKTTFNPSARSQGQSIESCISGPRKRIWRQKNESNQREGLNHSPLPLPRQGFMRLQASGSHPEFPTHADPRASSHLTVPISHHSKTGHNQDEQKGHRKEHHAVNKEQIRKERGAHHGQQQGQQCCWENALQSEAHQAEQGCAWLSHRKGGISLASSPTPAEIAPVALCPASFAPGCL